MCVFYAFSPFLFKYIICFFVQPQHSVDYGCLLGQEKNFHIYYYDFNDSVLIYCFPILFIAIIEIKV